MILCTPSAYWPSQTARAVMASDANFAASEPEAKQLLMAQFPPQTTDITTEQFLFVAKEVLRLRGKDGRLPCTLLILDEAQQYIRDSQQRWASYAGSTAHVLIDPRSASEARCG
jgi:hypothetical protein